MKKLLLTTVFLLLAVTSHAQVVLSVTGTASSTAAGYTSDDSYTFNFSLTPSFSSTSHNFSDSSNVWGEELLSDTPLFAAITGAVSGTLGRPSDPYAFIYVGNDGQIRIFAGTDAEATGLKSLGEADVQLDADFLLSGSDIAGFSFPESFVQPSIYFSAYAGSYTPDSGTIWVRNLDSQTLVSMQVTNLTISAVPEPATYAAFFGLGALGIAYYRRRVASI